jgi:hypothetical protein
VAVLALVVIAAAWFLRPGASTGGQPLQPPLEVRQGELSLPHAALESPATAATADSPAARTAQLRELHPLDASRFKGSGRIRGLVSIESGLEFPLVWSIAVEPSRVLIGGDQAQSRTLEFESGEQEFSFDDLALGGYSLRAQSFGLDSGERNVLLARPETDLYVTLTLSPTGFIEGRVVDVDGLGQEGLGLVLRPVEPGRAGQERETLTRAGGSFLIDDVKKGAYQLRVGSSDNPILPPISVQVHRTNTRVEDIVLPVLGVIEGVVVDAAGRILEDQAVDGYGDSGGSIRTRTDAYGEFEVRFLPQGRYTLFARSENLGVGKVRTQLAAGERAKVEIRLER